MRTVLLCVLALLICTPSSVAAQDFGYFETGVAESASVVNILLTFVTALALLLFLWGVAVFIFRAGDDTARQNGRALMIWGVVALFVLFSVWGIVAVLRAAFSVDGDETYAAPGLDTPDEFEATPATGGGAPALGPNAPAPDPAQPAPLPGLPSGGPGGLPPTVNI